MKRFLNLRRLKGAVSPLPGINCVVVLLWLVSITPAWAHDPGLSVATASVTNGGLAIHLAMAQADAERLLYLDANQNGRITDATSQAALSHLLDLSRK